MPAATTYEIGAALGSIATLSSLGIENPESQFIDYPASDKLADGTTRAKGFPQATWHYGYMDKEWFDALSAFVTATSATVCIATMNNDRDFVRYNCVMVLPDRFIVRNTKYMDVTINFNRLVAAE